MKKVMHEGVIFGVLGAKQGGEGMCGMHVCDWS